MKKLIAILLAMVLSLSLFACSDNGKKKDDIKKDDDIELDDTPGGSSSGIDQNISPINPVDYQLGEYKTSATQNGIVYTIYEDGAVVYDCSSTADIIEIPGTVESTVVKVVGNAAFYKSNASEIKLPDSIEHIGENAFRSSANLKKVDFPENLKTIGDKALAFTGIESAVIDASVSYGNGVYYSCDELTSFSTAENVTEIPAGIVASCKNLTDVTIGSSVTKIGDEAFFRCTNIDEIDLPENLDSIGNKAFYGCSAVSEVVIPNSVKTIEGYAFYNCDLLNDVSFGSSVEEIGEFAFYGCDLLVQLDLPASLKTLGKAVFGSLNIESITIPSEVKTIPEMAFVNCVKLGRVNFSSRLTSIEAKAFMNTALESFEVPASVTSIGAYAFKGCAALKNVSIKGKADLLPEGIFQGCTALTVVSLPQTVETVASYAFDGCTSIKDVRLPAALKTIKCFAFRNCVKLEEIELHRTSLNELGMGAFSNCISLTEVTIPATCYSIMLKDAQIPSSVSVNGLFDGCTSLSKVTILGQVEEIGTMAFANCPALKTVILPDSLKVIGVDAFKNCLVLEKVELGANITTLGRGAFYNCPALKELRFSENLISIGDYAIGFLENDVIIEGVTTKPVINKDFTAYGYLGSYEADEGKTAYYALELYVRSYLDGDGNSIAYVGLGVIGDITTEHFKDFEYEIIEDGIEFTETVVNQETGEEEAVVVKKDAVKILSYKGNSKIVVVPEMFAINDLYVIEISEGAFKNNSSVEVIYVPSWMKTIGDEAFANCSKLVELIFVNTSYTLAPDAPEGSVAGELALGSDLITGSDNVKVYAPAGSYVKTNERALGWTVSVNIPSHS